MVTGYIRINDLANDIGVNPKTVAEWIKSGLICYRPSQRMVLVKQSDLDKFMKKFRSKRTDIDEIVENITKDLLP